MVFVTLGSPWSWRALLGLALTFGCSTEKTVQATVYGVRVDQVEGVTGVSPGFARAALDRAVEHAAVFDPPDAAGGSTLGARLRYAPLEGPTAEVLRVELELEAPAELIAALGERFEATVEFERPGGAIDIERDLPIALERAVAVLQARVELARGQPEAVQRLLADADPEMVLLALDWVTDGRRREHLPSVRPLLEHAEPRVAVRAVECVGDLGGPQDVPALVAAARLVDQAHTGRLYEALAALGGPDAEGFLGFAARNEDNPALAEIAQRALAKVRHEHEMDEAPSPARTGTWRGHR